MRAVRFALLASVAACAFAQAANRVPPVKKPATAATETPAKPPERTVFDFSLATLDGQNAPLSVYKDKVILLCVVADKSEYSSQLPKLDEVYKQKKEAGLVVLGVPTTDFGGEAIATQKEVAAIYRDKLKLSFPVFAPTIVRGKKIGPLFEHLAGQTEAGMDGKVHWVFSKLLFNRKGKLVADFDSDIEPDSPELQAAIEKTLANEDLHPKKDEDKKKAAPANDSDDDDEEGAN